MLIIVGVLTALLIGVLLWAFRTIRKQRGVIGKLRRMFGAVGAATEPKRKYQDYYNEETQEFVAEKYAADIANFDYKFSPVVEAAPHSAAEPALAR